MSGLLLHAGTAGSKVPGKVERLLDAGDVTEAIELLEERAAKKPGEADVYLALADIYHDFSSVRDARKELAWLLKAQAVYRAAGDTTVLPALNGRVVKVKEKVDDLDFADAERASTQKALETYLKVHTDGRHRDEATRLIDNLDYAEAKAAGTVAGYQGYLEEHPQGYHSLDADHAIQDLQAAEALGARTEREYTYFLSSKLGSNYYDRPRIQRELYELVTAGGTVACYERYIHEYGEQPERAVADLVATAYGFLYARVDRVNRAQVKAYIDRYPEATNLDRAVEDLYQTYVAEGTEAALAKYLTTYPESVHRPAAERLLYDTYYVAEIASLSKFVAKYPESSVIAEASARLYELEFDAAVASNNADKIIAFVQKYPNAPQVADAEKKIFDALKSKLVVEMNTRTSYSRVTRPGYDYTTVDRDGWDDDVTGSTRHYQASYEETVADGSHVELTIKNNNSHPLLVKIWAGHYESSGWGGRTGDSESWKIVVGPNRGSVVNGYLSNVAHEAEWQIKEIKVLAPREYTLYRQCETSRTIPNHQRFLDEFPNSAMAGDIRDSYRSLVRGLVDYDPREHREKGNVGWYATYRNKSSTYTLQVTVQGQTFTLAPGRKHDITLVRKYPSPDSVEIVR